MPRLVGLGLLAAALFSITFILNRAMSLSGGHWVWSATLRYVDVTVLLTLWIGGRHGMGRLTAILRLFLRQLRFWLLSGGVGFGVFYACICYAADHALGWIVAASWQLTILATPIIMSAFGTRVPLRGTAFCGIIALGIFVVNMQRIGEGVTVTQVATGIFPVLVAAFAYPFGNQMVNRMRHSNGRAAAVLADSAAAVLLLTLGSLPLFVGLVLLASPSLPATGQVLSTAIVALAAGAPATPLFLHASPKARRRPSSETRHGIRQVPERSRSTPGGPVVPAAWLVSRWSSPPAREKSSRRSNWRGYARSTADMWSVQRTAPSRG